MQIKNMFEHIYININTGINKIYIYQIFWLALQFPATLFCLSFRKRFFLNQKEFLK